MGNSVVHYDHHSLLLQMNLDSVQCKEKHIRFSPLPNSYLSSVDNATEVSSITACAYSCYHSACCLSFSYIKETQICEMSQYEHVIQLFEIEGAEVYTAGTYKVDLVPLSTRKYCMLKQK